ncbi:DNA polymerase II large subunit [archaeon]|nr:DNA polymerase II large subunit [archaeon]|tara:strand:- start:1065 stop:6560 length:5496 start_codon:yes stop_codon:yes gene_type:complete
MEKYFLDLDKKIKESYDFANKARKKGIDPEDEVDIPLASGIGKRVEGLISVEVKQVLNSGIAERIKELEIEYGVLDWRIALKIAEEVANEKFCSFKDEKEAMETAIRVGFAYLTLGVVSAPLEGFIELKIKNRRDGKKYLAVCYAGPVRGAGGTAAAFSVILADHVRKLKGYDIYDPDENEIKRYITELNDYHDRVTNLQYRPSEKEIEFLMKHIPIEISGDPTEKIEVSNYKDLGRVETNRIRGGIALVVAEGIAQKASKLWKRMDEWGKDFNLDWGFLKDFLKLQKKVKARDDKDKKSDELSPDFTFISDLVAGRPVLTHPLAKGGFRLRYGRNRLSGFSSRSIHPATMYVLNNFIAIGTQLKVERPGKATVLSVCDDLECPIVRLKNGNVLFLENLDDVKKYKKEIEEILFLGDMLVNYGDFSENNHSLVPAGYCEEWWIEEVKKSVNKMFNGLDFMKLSSLIGLSEKELEDLFNNPINYKLSADMAIRFSSKLDVALHPKYTYHWNDINKEQFLSLLDWFNKGIIEGNKVILPLVFDINDDLKEIDVKRVLELLGVPHIVVNKESVVIEKEDCKAFLCSLGYYSKEVSDFEKVKKSKEKNVLKLINEISEVRLKDKSGTYIGARMGRPEKAKIRKLTGSPHVLFPVGKEGGRLRSFQAAVEVGSIVGDFPNYFCKKCEKDSVFFICEVCGEKTIKQNFCNDCCKVIEGDNCEKHGECISYKNKSIDIGEIFKNVKKGLDLKVCPDLIKGVRGTSNKTHVPEHLGKGILRSLHDVYVNKDGTIRYDVTEMPITHFRCKEIGVSVSKLKELGYEKDIKGEELVDENQMIELKAQDVILPACEECLEEGSDKVFFRVSKFIDELLVRLYKEKSYYNLKKKEDLIGHLIISLAPHTSAGVVGRIIGFSKTQGFLAHPLYHAAHRRDCFSYDTRIPIFDGEKWSNVKIGDFVEKLKLDKVVDRYGTKVKKVRGLYTVGYDKEKNETKLVKINEFSKHEKNKLFKVKIKDGKEIIVTETHKFVVNDKGKFKKKRLINLVVGDKLVVPVFKNSFEDVKNIEYEFPEIVSIDDFKKDVSYCLNVEGNVVLANGVLTGQCDGDEIGFMLLMDGLLNFSRQYLPDRRGGRSVTKNTIVFIEEDGIFKTVEIGNYVDKIMKDGFKKTEDDYEILKNSNPIKALSFDEKGNVKLCDISSFIRHKCDRKVYEIKTSDGFIEVTEDHSLFVVEDGVIKEIKVSELMKGMELVTLGSLKLKNKILDEVDVMDVLETEELYVVPDKSNLDLIKKTTKLLKKYGNNFYRYLNMTRSAPLSFYKDCGIVPNCFLRTKGRSKSIPYKIKLNEDFFKLLGFIYAEGCIRKDGLIEIGNTDKKVIDEIFKAYSNILKNKPVIFLDKRKEKYGSGVYYRINFPKLFGKLLLKLGVKHQLSKEKEIPDFVFRASEDNINSFIKGYCLGDGTIYEKKKYIRLYTYSRKLASGLSLLAYLVDKKSSCTNSERGFEVTMAEYKPRHPFWPLRHKVKEIYKDLRKEYSKKEASAIVSNMRRNTRLKSCSKHKILSLIKKLKDKKLVNYLKSLLKQDIRVERVVDVKEKNYEGYVYDLEVPKHQNFLCGPHPIFAHNSMDAPLVLSSKIIPSEVDDMVHGMDVVWKYPLELYEAAEKFKYPYEVKVKQLKERLETEKEYSDFGYTHDVDDLNKGIKCSDYKILPTMEEKVRGQMKIAESIRAVDEMDVAKLVIEKHFIRDIRGNLRKFSMQQFRCVKCNEKFRRPPLDGNCRCGGRIIFTISHGGIVKYLEPAIGLAEKYALPPYLKQNLDLVKMRVESIFGKDPEKQEGLGKWV